MQNAWKDVKRKMGSEMQSAMESQCRTDKITRATHALFDVAFISQKHRELRLSRPNRSEKRRRHARASSSSAHQAMDSFDRISTLTFSVPSVHIILSFLILFPFLSLIPILLPSRRKPNSHYRLKFTAKWFFPFISFFLFFSSASASLPKLRAFKNSINSPKGHVLATFWFSAMNPCFSLFSRSHHFIALIPNLQSRYSYIAFPVEPAFLA